MAKGKDGRGKSGGGGGQGTGGGQRGERSVKDKGRGFSQATPSSDVGADAFTPAAQSAEEVLGSYNRAMDNWRDYRDTDNTFLEDVGNFVAGSFGFNERPPTAQEIISGDVQDRATWTYDPAGLIGGLAVGGGAGIPLVGGIAANLISEQLGRPLAVDIGPDVFGSVTPKSKQRERMRTGSAPSLFAPNYVDQYGVRREYPVYSQNEDRGRTYTVPWWREQPVTPAPEPEPEPEPTPAVVGLGSLSTLTPIRLQRFRDPTYTRRPPALFR